MEIQWGSQMTIDEWLSETLNHAGDNQDDSETYKIKKPIRLLELFSGIGCQVSALKRLDYPFESYRTSEWDTQAIEMYNAMHIKDYTDYSSDKTVEELADWLDKKGTSLDGKTPLPKNRIMRKGEKWIRRTYNNYIATHNIGSIVNAKGGDLGINESDKYTYILTYSFP